MSKESKEKLIKGKTMFGTIFKFVINQVAIEGSFAYDVIQESISKVANLHSITVLKVSFTYTILKLENKTDLIFCDSQNNGNFEAVK